MNFTDKELAALTHLHNGINQHGRMMSVRELMIAMEYRSPRSAALILEKLAEKQVLNKKDNGKYVFNQNAQNHGGTNTVEVPVLGITSCGGPVFAEENIQDYYPISTKIAKPGSKHFFLRAQGDSMDLAGIQDGDLVLVRQQITAKNGDRVVALIDDSTTIKEFERDNMMIILKPRSTNPDHKPIILSQDFQIQGIVIQSFSNL